MDSFGMTSAVTLQGHAELPRVEEAVQLENKHLSYKSASYKVLDQLRYKQWSLTKCTIQSA